MGCLVIGTFEDGVEKLGGCPTSGYDELMIGYTCKAAAIGEYKTLV